MYDVRILWEPLYVRCTRLSNARLVADSCDMVKNLPRPDFIPTLLYFYKL